MKPRRWWRLRHRFALLAVSLFAMSITTGGCNCQEDENGDDNAGMEDMAGEPDMGGMDMDEPPDPDMDEPDPDMDEPDPDMDEPDMRMPDMGGMMGEGEITGLREAGTQLSSPFDATPSPDAETIYFVGMKADGGGALFSVPAGGGAETVVAEGFVAPLGLVMSMDGARVYVADVGTDDEDTNATGGVIWDVTVADGATAPMDDTVGYQPRSVDYAAVGGEETLYFTGVDPADGGAGVFAMPPGGGTVTAVAKGGPINDPSGVAVTTGGDVYVADTVLGNISGIVLVSNGTASNFVEQIRVGYPAGIALSQDESHLLVSGLDLFANSAVVYRVTLADQSIQQISMGIEQNSESAGVHRAHNLDQYAWANAASPNADGTGGGTVYLLGTAADPLN